MDQPLYVEFVYRVHADGRQERRAQVTVRRGDGSVGPATGRLEGSVADFAADAIRRVVLDPREEDRRRARRYR